MNYITKNDQTVLRGQQMECVQYWVASIIQVKRAFFRHDRRTAPKFGTHVRIDTLTLKKYKI